MAEPEPLRTTWFCVAPKVKLIVLVCFASSELQGDREGREKDPFQNKMVLQITCGSWVKCSYGIHCRFLKEGPGETPYTEPVTEEAGRCAERPFFPSKAGTICHNYRKEMVLLPNISIPQPTATAGNKLKMTI